MPRRVGAVAVVAVTTVLTVGGCTQTIGGHAQRAGREVPDPVRSYGYVEDRCGLLLDSTVQQILRADDVVRSYSGAVCQYVLSRVPDTLDVTYSWFEAGSFDRERALAAERKAQITDIAVEGHPAFLSRRPVTWASCSATAAAGTGVASWWVQVRGKDGGPDTCGDAQKLLAATLASDM